MPDFLTIDEAVQFTSKSASTILRFVRKNKGDNGVVHSELVDGHWQYRINSDILRAKYAVKQQETGKKQETTSNDDELSSGKYSAHNSKLLDSVIATLQKQLEEKDKTIQALISHNHQLSGALAQLQLPAPKKQAKPENGEIVQESDKPEEKQASKMPEGLHEKRKTSKPSSKKKRSFLSRLFFD